MEPQVIWIKIDPGRLIQDKGFDCQSFFGVDSFLKFNITPDEIDGNDEEPGNTNANSTNLPTLESDGLDNSEEKDIKIEQNVKSEFDQDLKPNNRQGIPSECSECGLTVSSMARLKEHLKVVHNTDLRFPCDHCDKMFLRKSLLEHKRFIVEKKSKVSCNMCEKMFTRKRDLKYHEMEKHDTQDHPEPVGQCEKCSKKFSTKKNFDLHMLQDICDPEKWKKRRLERKIEAERSGRFKCTFDKCEKLYHSRSHLDRHIMIHTNERPYQCDKCEMAFHQKGSLKEHIRVHTGEKPYQCEVCPNSYAQGGAFKAHLRTHNDDESTPNNSEIKTSKSKDANFRDYYLNGTFLETKPYSGRGRPPNLKTHTAAKSLPDEVEAKI